MIILIIDRFSEFFGAFPMIMMCYMYCETIFGWLFFASAPLLFLLSLFMLKRGVMQRRVTLRQTAFIFMFLSALKVFILDAYLLHGSLLCSKGMAEVACNVNGFRGFGVISLLMLMISSFLIFAGYRRYIKERHILYKSYKQVHIRFWANTSMALVITLIFWLIVPWGHYLIMGDMSIFSLFSSWRALATAAMFMIIMGFWRYEECNKQMDVRHNVHTANAWKPKDTLWLAISLLIITVAFSLATEDVLTK